MNEAEREIAKTKITECVVGWLNGLVEEAMDMADQNDPKVNWDNPEEIADWICGCLAMLCTRGQVLDEVEAILSEQVKAEAQK